MEESPLALKTAINLAFSEIASVLRMTAFASLHTGEYATQPQFLTRVLKIDSESRSPLAKDGCISFQSGGMASLARNSIHRTVL